MVGRTFTATEQRGCTLERLLLTAAWAIRKLARFTMYLPAITVILPHPAAVQCARVGDGLTPRLQARLVELSSYHCTYEVGDGAWAVGGVVGQLKGTVSDEEVGDLWQHEDIVLKRPESAAQLPADLIAGALKLHFDGACRTRASQKEGAGGFIAWDREG